MSQTPPKNAPQIFTSQSSSQFPWKIIAGVLVFLILLLVGFNFTLDRYGRFWEKKVFAF